MPPANALVFGFSTMSPARVDAWWNDIENSRLLERLYTPQDRALAGDKAAFADWAQAQGFPAIPTLELWSKGQNIHPGHGDRERDLVVKPRSGSRAQGVALCERSGDGYRIADRQLSQSDVSNWLQEHSVSLDLLVQPRLVPHPDLHEISWPAAPFIRMNTIQTVGGDTQVLNAYLFQQPRTAFVSTPADRAKLPIDLTTGATLRSKSPIDPAWSQGHAAEGIQLPDWQRACDIARAAHAAFPGPIMLIGWDIAFTPEGPVLIEPNTGLGFNVLELATGTPVCDGPLCDILDEWIARNRV